MRKMASFGLAAFRSDLRSSLSPNPSAQHLNQCSCIHCRTSMHQSHRRFPSGLLVRCTALFSLSFVMQETATQCRMTVACFWSASTQKDPHCRAATDTCDSNSPTSRVEVLPCASSKPRHKALLGSKNEFPFVLVNSKL